MAFNDENTKPFVNEDECEKLYKLFEQTLNENCENYKQLVKKVKENGLNLDIKELNENLDDEIEKKKQILNKLENEDLDSLNNFQLNECLDESIKLDNLTKKSIDIKSNIDQSKKLIDIFRKSNEQQEQRLIYVDTEKLKNVNNLLKHFKS